MSRVFSNDLDKHGTHCSVLPAGITADRICYLATNDAMHFAFLDNGIYIAVRSDRLDSERSGMRYDLARLTR